MRHQFIIRKRFNNRYFYYQGCNTMSVQPTAIWTAQKADAERFDNPADAYHRAQRDGIAAFVISMVPKVRNEPDDTVIYMVIDAFGPAEWGTDLCDLTLRYPQEMIARYEMTGWVN